MTQRGFLGVFASDRRGIHVTRPVLFVANVAFIFEDPKHRAHGRITRRIRKGGQHLGCRRPPPRIKDVDNLPFTTAEVVMWSVSGHLAPKAHEPLDGWSIRKVL